MNKIDVDKLTLFYDKLTKLTSDCEENWYLVKRIMSEMEMEEEFHNPQVYQELYDSIQNQQKKEVILVEGAPHIGPYFYDKEMYMKKIKDCIFS